MHAAQVAAATLSVVICSIASATIVAYEDFAYPPGSMLSNANGGLGFTSAWRENGGTSGVLGVVSAPAGFSSGAFGVVSAGLAASQFVRSIPSTESFLQPLYISALIRDTPGDESVRIGFSGVGGDSEFYVSSSNRYALPTARLSRVVPTVSGVDLVILKIFQGQLSLFVNPSLTDPLPVLTAPTSMRQATQLRLVAAGFVSPGSSFIVDDVRVGTTFADIVPAPGPAASLALLGLAAAVRRRR